MRRDRNSNIKAYEDRYVTLRIRDNDGHLCCLYCGDPYTDLDHVPPISKVREYEKFDLPRYEYLKVPCCSNCNSMLGASLQRGIEERYFELKKRLAKKYDEALSDLFEMEDYNRWNPDKEFFCAAIRTRARRLLMKMDYRDGIENLCLR